MSQTIQAIRAQIARLKALEKKELARRRRKETSFARKHGRIRGLKRMSAGERDRIENFLESKLGPSPRHSTWRSLAERYPDRFEEALRDLDEQSEFDEED